jgi:hypothetical protein
MIAVTGHRAEQGRFIIRVMGSSSIAVSFSINPTR